VVDAKNLTVTKHLDLSSKGVDNGSGLSLDVKNHILFSYWRLPTPEVVIVNAENGAILDTLPTDVNVDTVGFNPATMEAISTAGAGSIVFVKENSPTSFAVEHRLKTIPGARNMVANEAAKIAQFVPKALDTPRHGVRNVKKLWLEGFGGLPSKIGRHRPEGWLHFHQTFERVTPDGSAPFPASWTAIAG
jgi:hypothetical protein